jgi:hypothetical protein
VRQVGLLSTSLRLVCRLDSTVSYEDVTSYGHHIYGSISADTIYIVEIYVL